MEIIHRNQMLACGAMLFLLPFLNAQAPPITPFSADTTMTTPEELAPPGSKVLDQNEKGKIYVAQAARRSESRGFYSGLVIIYNVATKTSTFLLSHDKSYVEHATTASRLPWTDPLLKGTWDPTNPCASQPDHKCENTGAETIDGRACEHWRITDDAGHAYDLWVDNRLHYPIRMSSKNAKSWKLTKIKEGEPDASLFQIPPGYTKDTCRKDCME